MIDTILNYTPGTAITGLSSSTTYRVSLKALGNGTDALDSLESAKRSVTTSAPTSTSSSTSSSTTSTSTSSSTSSSTTTAPTTTTTIAPTTTTAPPTTTTTLAIDEAPVGEGLLTMPQETVVQTPVTRFDRGITAGETGFNFALSFANGPSFSAEGSLLLRGGLTSTVSGIGFRAGSIVEVWVHSTPTLVGTVSVGADGTFSAEFTFPSGVPAGAHTVEVRGRTRTVTHVPSRSA